MILCENLLLTSEGKYEVYAAGQKIFEEGSEPKYYFQIINGTVEMNNLYSDGSEFIQNILSGGQSLGEFMLFSNRPYPANAVAKTECSVIKIAKENFFNLINHHPDVSLNIMNWLADRLYANYLMMFGLSSSSAVSKISAALDTIKVQNDSNALCDTVPYTRQQLANLTGLRVETVIRAIKKMEQKKLLKIKNGKIILNDYRRDI